MCPGCASNRTAAGKSAGVTISKRFIELYTLPSAASTRSGVIGKSRIGTPTASDTAHATTAAEQTCAASPNPITPDRVLVALGRV